MEEPDGFTRTFGTAIPRNIPESTAWWSAQSKDLFALTEEGEQGMMQAMVTTIDGRTVLRNLSEKKAANTSPYKLRSPEGRLAIDPLL